MCVLSPEQLELNRNAWVCIQELNVVRKNRYNVVQLVHYATDEIRQNLDDCHHLHMSINVIIVAAN